MTDLATAPYKIGLSDHSAFVVTWLRRNVFSRGNLVRFALFAVLISGLMAFYSHPIAEKIGQKDAGFGTFFEIFSFLFGIALAAILVYGLAPLTTYLLQILSFQGRPRVSQTVRLTDAGVEKAIDGESHTFDWDVIEDVVETKKTVLLFTARNSAMIVSKAAFPSPSDARAFIDIIKARCRTLPKTR